MPEVKFSFLHASDLHLGYFQHRLRERVNDFALAAQWTAEQAVENRVDFVVLSGDLFQDRSNLQPRTLRQAEHMLRILKNADIPCVLIEGNHDRPYYRDGRDSWCDYLASQDLATLLNFIPGQEEELQSANNQPGGNYLEVLNGVLVLGVGYKGAGLRSVLQALQSRLGGLCNDNEYSILALHSGLNGQLPAHLAGGLGLEDLDPFRDQVDYVALGHYHRPFQLENWIFNPGSPEVTAWDQYREDMPGGAELVHVDTAQSPMHRVTHLPYAFRPRIRVSLPIKDAERTEELVAALEAELFRTREELQDDFARTRPMLRITLKGELRFDAARIAVAELEAAAQRLWNPLHCQILQTDLADRGFPDAEDTGESLAAVEYTVLQDLIARNATYGKDPDKWLNAVLSTADLVQSGADARFVYEHLSSFDGIELSSLEGA